MFHFEAKRLPRRMVKHMVELLVLCKNKEIAVMALILPFEYEETHRKLEEYKELAEKQGYKVRIIENPLLKEIETLLREGYTVCESERLRKIEKELNKKYTQE